MAGLLDEQICLALRPLILHKLIIETATSWVVLQALYTLLKTTFKFSVILTVNLRLIFYQCRFSYFGSLAVQTFAKIGHRFLII
jgi:hypothetical protein